jgi:predicted RNA-binding Zn-ribbon protein involved in translation (DUF1610 family)
MSVSKGLRLTEKWMQRGLWLVAFVFAGFLIGLGGKVVDNMWKVEPPKSAEQFIDPARGAIVKAAAADAEAQRKSATAAFEQAEQQHAVAESNTRSAQQMFENWLATRRATARADQDPELVARTRELDALKAAERKALAAVQAQQQALLNASQARDRAAAEWQQLESAGWEAAQQANRAQELRIFLYRLAMTLPLLLMAGWLFAKKRHGQYWPFVWGFIFFALFAFFVELVPYLPSYGGYVRYSVGIVLTAVIGRYAIISLQRYLERQKAAEALPDVKRRETLRYDSAMARLDKSVCPGCERSVDLKNDKIDFCPHCGIGLFDRCSHCATRKGAFARFCFSCGTAANVSLTD